MQVKFIFFLIVATIVVVFAAQNHITVDVKLFKLTVKQVPVSVIILVSMLFGTLVMAAFEIMSIISLKIEMAKKNSEIKKLKKKIDENEPKDEKQEVY